MSNIDRQTEQKTNIEFGDADESRSGDYRIRVQALNDGLRQTGIGGRIVTTCGIAALSRDEQLGIIAAVRAFDRFDADNDPHGEHDFGALRIGVHHIMFKIDYFDRNLRVHSPDPSDPGVTCRLLTIMLADEL